MRQAGFENFSRGFVHPQFHFLLIQTPTDGRQKFLGDGLVNQKRFHGVADGGPLAFGVEGDFLRHFQVCRGIDEYMANAFIMFDYGNLRAFRNGADQSLSASRHAKIDILRQR